MSDADRQSWIGRMWARGGWTPSFVTGVVVAAVLAAAGGFETGHIPLVPRFAYWIGLVMAGVVVAQLIRGRLARAPWFWRSRWLAAGAIAAGTTVPMTAVVGVSSAMIMGEPLRLARFYFVFPDVVAMAVGVTVLAVLVHGNGPAETRAAAGPDASGEVPPPKFLARLPPKLAGAALFAVEAQDHYLRLHTSKGQDLILMRLSDAIAELDGIEGARTHRSWWVARGAVVSAERAEGRATLTLTDGAQAPVSRSYVKPLREAGWF